ncbi:DNA-binding response regulator, OmpR family, contains REC and winged-helix (wHTH) domain [Terribacillus halophilus]|uniref:DNA-binding response regulator, OmpR family, contains REC and winged-helix (WHTH) domain n=1 Tax=Terribacillus halophilus TaxID=361279 RepID=A0A1G6L0M9_9BACI|nr:response regulator transcription factor [Terribacillus halophilus]SDC36754.1 DNA-binding response regulator, OmpR family, contains REC and winged-helix (wHTH) domain [Terribacillus halophilus]
MNESIMLVEDDAQINEMVSDHLKKEGYEVFSVFDGQAALDLFARKSVDLIILDLMLPSVNGLDMLQLIRRKSMLPILIMSAKDSDVDKALGLGFGADDYIGKPFSLIELTARVKAVLRRSKQYSLPVEEKEQLVQVRDLIIDLNNFSVSKRGEKINLTAKEFQILRLLATSPNQVFTKGQLFESVWKEAYYGDDNVINVHIRRLRGKIEDDASAPMYIKTVWGIGYKMEMHT